jgi:hypothetical protein
VDDDKSVFVQLPVFHRKRTAAIFRAFMQVLSSDDFTPDRLAAAAEIDSSLAAFAISASLSDVEKSPQSAAVRRRAAYRLAANINRIRRGWPCPPGDVAVGEFVAAKLIGIAATMDAGGTRSFYRVSYRVLTGRAAGMQVLDRFSVRAAPAIFYLLVGRLRKCSPFSPLLLGGLECAIRLTKEMGEVKVKEVGVSRSQRSRNAKLTKRRFRAHADCPVGFGVDCANCVVGQSECALSVHYTVTHYLAGSDDDQRTT